MDIHPIPYDEAQVRQDEAAYQAKIAASRSLRRIPRKFSEETKIDSSDALNQSTRTVRFGDCIFIFAKMNVENYDCAQCQKEDSLLPLKCPI